MLSGKYTRENRQPDGSGRGLFVGRHLTEGTFTLLDALRRIASAHGTTVAAVALAWVRQQQPVTATIIGARTVGQLAANLASLHLDLSPTELAELGALTAPQLAFPLPFLHALGFPAQQGSTSINGIRAGA